MVAPIWLRIAATPLLAEGRSHPPFWYFPLLFMLLLAYQCLIYLARNWFWFWFDVEQDCCDPPTRALLWASWAWPLSAAKHLVPPLVPPTATLPDEQPWSPVCCRKAACLAKACRWADDTPPALAELLHELAFTRCDVGMVDTSSVVIMPIVTPNRKLILFIS